MFLQELTLAASCRQHSGRSAIPATIIRGLCASLALELSLQDLPRIHADISPAAQAVRVAGAGHFLARKRLAPKPQLCCGTKSPAAHFHAATEVEICQNDSMELLG